jgi:hypothetical protein
MKETKLNKITADLKKKYPDAGVQAVEVNEKDGTSTLYLRPKERNLAFLETGGVIPKIRTSNAAVITRDLIDRTLLDLAKKDPYTEDPKVSFEKAIRYYHTDPMLGPTINFLSSVSNKGFEHDIDDANIKNFFDVWAFDVGLHQVLEWIFLDFFKVGQVVTYKVLSKYEPRISYLSPVPGKKMKKASVERGESAAKKKTWSKGYIPVAYTVLNPQLITIEGNLLFNNTRISLQPPKELQDLLKKKTSELTEAEKELIKNLPSDFKNAVEKGTLYPLEEDKVGIVTYRKQPYERYPRPRSLRLFDAFEYKRNLKEADLSTLDGITNYILKITIGNDEFPATSQDELNAVAQLFNTPSKSFDVVWNHTLAIEKIVSPEISAILGIDKYEQVNSDITAGLAISRAFIDGVAQNMNTSSAQLIVKGVQEEIDYARRQVTNWIYQEYQQIAEAMGFDRFPKIRWDESVLKDTIMYMNIISQLVDRRMLSYQSALELLGFDYNNELTNMQTEMKLVEDGVFGIIGSPWQQAKMKQPVQGGPAGTPSAGRPKGTDPNTKKTPQKNPAKKNTTDKQTKTKPQAQQVVKSSLTISDVVKNMSEDEFEAFKLELSNLREE